MSYLITKTDGTVLGTIDAQTTNTTFSSLTLIGEALLNYGQIFNDNLIYLIENFSNAISPKNPLSGQLWYNTSTQALNLYSGVSWGAIASQNWVESNFTSSATSGQSNIITQNIISSSGYNTNGTKSSYSSNYFISNGDSLLSAIGKLDNALGSSGNALSGYLTLAAAQTLYAPLISPALTGIPTAPNPASNSNSTQIATTSFVNNNFLNVTSAGSLFLTVVAAHQTYAPLISPALSGAPTSPTATAGTNSTQIANTSFVDSAISTATSTILNDVASVYVSTNYAQSNYAPKNSPNFTGVPTAPNPNTGSNSTQIATTAFVNGAFSFAGNGYQKLPSGLIIQWGSHTLPNGSDNMGVVFPISFPNAFLQGFACEANATGTWGVLHPTIYGVSKQNNSQMQVWGETWSGTNWTSGGGISFGWFAIGF